MSRAIMIAATAIAASWSSGAHALTPFTIDSTGPMESDPPHASPYAIAPPSSFEPPPTDGADFRPRLFSRGQKLQCVPFARRESGLQIFGDAARWWAQARARLFNTDDSPKDGAVMVMRGYRDARRGHVAVVREVVHDRLILVDHANWLNRGEITRAVPVRDVSTRGDWSQIQVWHVPGGHWGGRTYNVQGFILPQRTEQAVAIDLDAPAAAPNAILFIRYEAPPGAALGAGGIQQLAQAPSASPLPREEGGPPRSFRIGPPVSFRIGPPAQSEPEATRIP